MGRKPLLIFILGLIVVGAIAAIFFAGERTKNLQNIEVEQPAEESQAVGRNVTFAITQNGKKKWEILVDRALYFDDKTGATLEKVKGEFYNDAGQPVGTFSAPAGKYLSKNDTITLTDGVTAQTLKGENDEKEGKKATTVTAKKMTWSSKSDKILAEGDVVVDMADMGQSTAQKGLFSLDFSYISLQGNVISKFNF